MGKKKIFKIIFILVLLVIASYFIYTKLILSSTSKPGLQTSSTSSDIEYYHCGMHPWITSDKPNQKCPICGMTLTPVYKNDKDQEGIVAIDPAMIQNIGVQTEVVSKRKLTKTIRTSGIVDYAETSETNITTKFSGYIEKLYVDYTGKPVQQGQPLFEIYSPELVAAQQEYLQAIIYKKSMSKSSETAALGADDLIQSAKRKLSLWDISSKQIAELEQSGVPNKALTFYSPFSGIVVEKNIFNGMQITAGMNLFKLAKLSPMWVYADVYENELSFVKVGDQAILELPYNEGETLQGKVSFIYPNMQDKSRTAKVRIEVPDIHSVLKKDMYVTVNIHPTLFTNAIAIPEQSIIHSGVRNLIVVSLGNGKFRSVEVKLGVLADGYYEIKEGLKEGDIIVTSSQFLIDSESNLKAGLSSMQNMPGMNMSATTPQKENDKPEANDSSMKDMNMK